MTQRSLSLLLRALVAASALIGLALSRIVIITGREAAWFTQRQEFFLPSLIFFVASVLVVYAALFLAWQIFADIGRDRSFTMVNARRLRTIAWLFCGDTVAYLLAVGVYELLTDLRGLTLVLMLAASFVGLGLSVISACLSHLVQKAAALRQENELTI